MSKSGFIDEVFVSYQGEGLFVGARQLFIRLSLCNLKCAYCDTKASQALKESFAVCGQKLKNPVTVSELLKTVQKELKGIHSVSITGGEPLVQGEFVLELAKALKKRGVKVFLETNGTLFKQIKRLLSYVDIISMDIKLPSTAKTGVLWKKHAQFLKVCDKRAYIKIVVSPSVKKVELLKAVKLAGKTTVFLQPESGRNIKQILNKLEKSGVFSLKGKDLRVLPQIHKIIGVR